MAEFHHERAIARYTELQKFIQAGAYDERDVDGSYGEDGIEKAVDDLNFQAAQHGLAFWWHKEDRRYSLEALDDENKAAFLHVNVENLISILAETARHLLSIPYESEMERHYRAGLHERITEALQQSYLVPVLREDYDPAILDERNQFTPSIANIATSAGDKDIDAWLARQDELTDGDGSGLHQLH